MNKPKSICVFGDSISWGAWDTEKGGWVNRLWFHGINRKSNDYIEIYNCSISGGTTNTILSNFENEAKNRNADALIFQTNGNDAAYENSPGNYLVFPEKFRNNIKEIIRLAKKITNNIIFVNIGNCDESKTTPVPWVDIYYTNESTQKYSKVAEEVCNENNVAFLSIKSLDDQDFDDGLHPNAIGHEKIFNQVKNFLTEKQWI
jgi:lysophospholipase L1-like esterase